jgi:hypothetical protein
LLEPLEPLELLEPLEPLAPLPVEAGSDFFSLDLLSEPDLLSEEDSVFGGDDADAAARLSVR